MEIDLLQKLAVALGLGLLVGMQREKVRDALAGIRTFALITLLGALSGLLSERLGPWVVGVGLAAVAALLAVGYLARLRLLRPSRRARLAQPDEKPRKKKEPEETTPQTADPGLTTEVAALLMFLVGAYVIIGDTAVGAVLGGAVFLLLHLKEPIHAFVGRLSETDLRAIMQFVLIALVILPVLPDEGYGPWGVLNPYHIWLMVVLIVGISLGGYVAFQLLGARVGSVLAGVLGGLISSTATTISYARRAAENPQHVAAMLGVLLLATTTAQGRVLVEIAAVAPNYWWQVSLPLLIFLAGMAVVSLVVIWTTKEGLEPLPPQKNPAELQSALIFGALYAGVTLAIAAAKEWLGESGMVGVAILSGMHDMDAITLTSARMVEQGSISATFGWQLILTASLTNIVMKTVYAYLLGTRELALRLAAWNAVFLAFGLGLLLLMPW